jgi:serine/threonine protein kinase
MVEASGAAELSDGDEFAGYRIERRLGRGGMGILYLAIEPGLDRRVALKLIAPEAAVDDVFARRFAEESRIAASIEHPNVVPIYAAGEEGGVPYIAMRFVSGSDLGRRLVREGRLEPVPAVALIAQIGAGLDAIHAAGLVHRDVKPANVLLSGEGADHAYITDFGVARNVATHSGLTQTGRFVGTLDYVAPEQISGGAVDARADVYALGCLLFKLLTGEVPFPRDGEAARLYAHLNDPPPAPSLYVPEVSMALDDVVIRALSKAPGDRHPSAGDLGRAAVAALSGMPVAVPEHTVATGAAATREATTREPPREPPTAASPPPPGRPPTGRTRPLEVDPGAPRRGPAPRRRLILAGALAAVAAVVAAAMALSSGGGGGDSPGASGQTTAPAGSGEGEAPTKAPTAPARLTKPRLIARADAICGVSKESFTASKARFPNGEFETNVSYSEELLENSSRALRELRKLRPPAGLESAFGRYLSAQKAVKKSDMDALAAARKGDLAAYEQARGSRDEGAPERQRIAEEIGFTVCSIPGG